jgi:hypothetical protein
MTPDQELVLIFGGLHLIALCMGIVLFVMFLRSDTTKAWKPPSEDGESGDGGGGGGNDRIGDRPKPRPTGGIPLPDADPAPVRLRDHERLSDLLPRPQRRTTREPARTPERTKR